MRNALNMLQSKIKFTYEPIPEIFGEIAQATCKSVGQVFRLAKENMATNTANIAWEKAVEESENNLIQEDKYVLKTLSKLLGQTDVEGQISQIEITQKFLETQLKEAQQQKEKNEKLYSKLGTTIGLAIVIILCWFYALGGNEINMDINLLFKIAAIGILVAVLHQVLVRVGGEDQAMMTTLAGLVIVLTMVIKEISGLFDTVRTVFNL